MSAQASSLPTLFERISDGVQRQRGRAYAALGDALEASDQGDREAALRHYERASEHLGAGLSFVVGDEPEYAPVRSMQEEMLVLAGRADQCADQLRSELAPQAPPPAPAPSSGTATSPSKKTPPPRPPPPTRRSESSSSASSAGSAAAADGDDQRSASRWKPFLDATRSIASTVTDLTTDVVGRLFPDAPPPPATQADIAHQLAKRCREQAGTDEVDAVLQFAIDKGVQLYSVDVDGNMISLLSADQPLQVLLLDGIRILKCGDWIFPLVQMAPSLRVDHRFYVFPSDTAEMTTAADGAAAAEQPGEDSGVVLILEKEVSEQDIQRLECLLAEYCDFRALTQEGDHEEGEEEDDKDLEEGLSAAIEDAENSTQGEKQQDQHEDEESEEPEDFGTRVASAIETGAHWLGVGILKTAEIGGRLISSGGSAIRSKLAPATEDKPVPQRVKNGVIVAKRVANTSFRVSGYLLQRAYACTDHIVSRIVPHVNLDGGEDDGDRRGNGRSRKSQAVHIARSTVTSVTDVFDRLEDAGVALARGLADETTSTVNHRYGSEAAAVTQDSLDTLGSAGRTALTVKKLTYKSLARSAAKRTAKEMISKKDAGASAPTTPKRPE
eukprot:m.268578 g.268578  ORF g.268578 m.268578 type:complete len:612 (+) comp11078_c2_seq3:444-2279(+)